SPGGAGNGEQCRGIYTGWTASDLEAATTTGACQNDASAVCARDLNTEAAACGQDCFAEHGDDAASLAACALQCLKEGDEADPADACLGCYLASVECVRVECLEDCLGNAASEACITCRAEKGCTQAFYECSGLPAPSAP
ncbi:MAG TPA: hypothetical protein VIM73_02920, partial [Polyangiaceae bacterium]